MTILKWSAGVFSYPLLLACMLATVGLIFRVASRRRTGLWLILTAGIVAYLASTPLVGNALLGPLEEKYPPFDPLQSRQTLDIVVLGSGYSPRDHIPVTGALSGDGLARIVEGVRLAHTWPDRRLLVSGGAPPGFTPGAVGYAELAAELGVQPSAMIMRDRALDTEAEARDVVALLGHSPFVLVTSAYHMPRAMRLMRRAGANPVPAPTGQLSRAHRGGERFSLIPGSRGLRMSEAALHEYLGLLALNLQID